MSDSNQDPNGTEPSDDSSAAPAPSAGGRKPLGAGKPLVRKLKKDGASAEAAPVSETPAEAAPAPAPAAAPAKAAKPKKAAAAAVAAPAADTATAPAPTPAAPAAKAAGEAAGGLAGNAKWGIAAFLGFSVLGIGYFAKTESGAAGKLAMGSSAPTSAASALAAAEGRKEVPCKDAKDSKVTPLVVDWTTDDRTELEVAMKNGIAVIQYACDGVKVLQDCKVDGAYKFTGTGYKERVIQLATADEVKNNLAKGAKSKGSASLDLERGASLDIATVHVGQTRSVLEEITTKDLKGKCSGATHVVRGAKVGAFAKDVGQKGKVKVAADLFGASSSLNSTANSSAKVVDGSLEACKKADADSTKPPPQCASVVTLELEPVLAEAKNGPDVKDSTEAGGCPKGMVFAQSKCVAKEDVKDFQCNPEDFDECKTQCDKGNIESCVFYGDLMSTEIDDDTGDKNPHYNQAASFAAYKKACDGGSSTACMNNLLGQILEGKISGAEATSQFEKAIQSGDNTARVLYGIVLTGSFEETTKLKKPLGIKRDVKRGVSLLSKACQAGSADGCSMFGTIAYQLSENSASKLSEDEYAFAIDANSRLCKPTHPNNCVAAAGLIVLTTNPQDSTETKLSVLNKGMVPAKVACDAKDNAGCELLKTIKSAKIAVQDMDKKKKLGSPLQALSDEG